MLVGDEWMVEVDGCGQFEQRLKQAVDMGRVEKVLAAGDMGDALKCVVDDYREVIGRSDVFAVEDHIAEQRGVDAHFAEAQVGEFERPAKFGCAMRIKTP